MSKPATELDWKRKHIENRMTGKELEESFEQAAMLAEELKGFVFGCCDAFWHKPKKILKGLYPDRAVVARALNGNWYAATDVSLDLLEDEIDEWALDAVDAVFDFRRKAKRRKSPLPDTFGTIDKKVMNPSGGFIFTCLDGNGGTLCQMLILPKNRYDNISDKTIEAAKA